MGIEKFVGQYTDAMTEPTGWPDIDEALLQQRSQDYLAQFDEIHRWLRRDASASAASAIAELVNEPVAGRE